MQNDIFIVMEGVEGESQDKTYAGSIEASSWHFTITHPSLLHTGAGKASISDLHFVHGVDRASPSLLRHSLTGKHVSQVRVVQRKAGGTPFECLKLTLDDVIVSHIEQACAGGLMLEHVALSFARLKQEYMVQDERGGSLGTVTVLIDAKKNTAT